MTEKEKSTSIYENDMATLTIYQRLCGINRDLEAIAKTGVNAQQGFKFRGIDAIADNLHPLLAKWGVVCAPRVVSARLEERVTAKGTPQVHAQLVMAWLLTGTLGDSLEISMPSEALDTSDKATNKALSAGFKYALTQLFTIPFNDLAESDKETPELGAKKVKNKEVSAEEAAKTVAEQQEAAGYLDVINSCKVPGDLPKVAKAIHDSALPEKYKVSLRAAFAQQREKLNSPPKKKEPEFVEDLGDQDAAS